MRSARFLLWLCLTIVCMGCAAAVAVYLCYPRTIAKSICRPDPKWAADMLLWHLMSSTHDAINCSHVYPPTDRREYAKWLMTHDPNFSPGRLVVVDKNTGMIVDPWKNPIVLIVEGDSVVGVGSSGPDGVWEDGKDDDIVRSFKEWFVPFGPGKSPYRRPEEPKE